MSIKKSDFKTKNGNSWDEHHFKTDSGQVLHTTEDGEQTTVEEELNRQNRNMKYTHLQSDVYGYIELPSGLKAVYGVYPLNGLASDAATGGYTRTIDISSYGLQDPVWAIATALYPSGWPETAVHHANKNEIKIGSKYNNAGGAIQWMVIG